VIFFFQAEDGIRDGHVTGVQTCALPIFFQVEASLAPRAALGQLIVAAAIALERANLVRSTKRERSMTAQELVRIRRRCRVETPLADNPAKSLAEKLVGHLLVIYSLQRMS